MQRLKNLKIFHKLVLASLMAGLFIAGLGGFALVRLGGLTHQIVDLNAVWLPSVHALLGMKDALLEYRIYEIQLLNTQDEALAVDYVGRLKQTRERFISNESEYVKLLSDPQQRRLYEEANVNLKRYWAAADEILRLVGVKDLRAAKTLLNGDSKNWRREAAKGLDGVAWAGLDSSTTMVKATDASYNNAIAWIVGSASGGSLLALLLGLFIARGITQPLHVATSAVDAMAEGRLDSEIEPKTPDETGLLLHATKKMQTSLREFSQALTEMARQHTAGAVEQRMDAARFPGIYAAMAKDVNDLVISHIVTIRRGREIIEQYGQGDFSLEHEALPGLKNRQAVAVNKVKKSFESISKEVMRLADAAARGDFTVRGDVAKYENEFRKMVEGLNRLMEVSDRGLAEITRVLAAIAEGDLTKSMEGDYAGSFGRLKDDANRTVQQLTNMLGEFHETTQTITAASNDIADGNTDLSSRTEQQASNLQETAASMAALTVTVMRNADNAEQANQLAIGASKVALKGGAAVAEVVKTMSSIDRRSATSSQ